MWVRYIPHRSAQLDNGLGNGLGVDSTVLSTTAAALPPTLAALATSGIASPAAIVKTLLRFEYAGGEELIAHMASGGNQTFADIQQAARSLAAGDTADIAPAFMQAVTFKGRPYAMPHHTDTFALYYNRDMMDKAGITLPTRLDQSWSWPDFIRVAQALKAGGAPFGFAMSWQNGTAYRWLPFLYQHGGQLLSDDLSRSQLATPAGIETLAWTQSWFRDKLVPPSTSIKSSEQSQNLFANGTVGMLMGGNWQIPFLAKNMAANWGVTYMPRDVAMASDLGGNCLAVSRDCKAPELAADVVKFMTGKANMQDFVTRAQFLPVRTSLMSERLPFALRPEAMQVFVEQATTIPPHLVSTVTLPVSSKINAALTDNLDLAFTAGRDPAETARAIDAQVQALLPA